MELINVGNEDEFRQSTEKKRSYRIQLNGGAFTKYTIWKKKNEENTYRVKSHFADYTETRTFEEMMDPAIYNFATAIERGSFFYEGK